MRHPIRLTLSVSALVLIAAGILIATAPSSSADSETSAFIGLVNMYRSQNGVPPLQAVSGMQSAAQWMAEDRADANSLYPPDSLGRQRKERLADYGVATSANGGFGAYGYAQGAGLFYSYMQSPNAFADLLCDPKYNAIGVGRTYQENFPGQGATFGWVWTVDLAKLSGTTTSNEDVDCEPLDTTTPPPTPTNAPTQTIAPTPTAAPSETPSGTATAAPSITPGPSGGTPTSSATLPPPPTIEPTTTPVTTPTPDPTPTPSAAPKLSGDTDCDLAVGSLDALQVLRETAGMTDIPGCIDTGDVDCDGDRDSVDALGILRFTADLPVSQPPTCPPIGWPV